MQSSGTGPGGLPLAARQARGAIPVDGGTPARSVRLAILHTNRDFRKGVRALLASEPDLAVVAEVETLDEATVVLRDIDCDVLLIYTRIDEQGLATIGRLSGELAVIVVAESQHDDRAMAAVRAGARSVVLNHLAVDGLVGAIRAVMLGHVSIPPALQAQLVAELRQMSTMPLTSRERDVTRLVAAGLRNVEIARRLSISEQTVKKHLNNIFQKLELRDRIELARYAIRSALTGATGGWGRSAAEVRQLVDRQGSAAQLQGADDGSA